MNKPQAKENLIPVRDYAKTRISRRGFPVTPSYIYKMIALSKEGKMSIDFDYVEDGKSIWIVKDN